MHRVPRWRHVLAIGAALWAAACSPSPPPSEPAPPSPREAGTSPRYDAVWQVATHNSYWVDRATEGDVFASGVGERILDQLLADHARGLEIDIHKSEEPHALRVYHTVPGNSLCDTLEECLGVLRAFHRALPEHEPVIVILELKELFGANFDENHTIADLDEALRDGLGPLLYQPADFLAPCDGHGVETLAECARTAEWPSIRDLRGRFLFAVLGNWDAVGAQATADWVAYATQGDIHDRAAFPMASSWKLDWTALPAAVQDLVSEAELKAASEQSVFLQIEAIDDPLAAPFLEGHGIVRVDNAFSVEDQAKVVSLGMQLLQSDAPWTSYDDRGPEQPLRAIEAGLPDEELREPGQRLLLSPADGALVFAHLTADGGMKSAWETVVSAGADPSRQGCLRAASAIESTEGVSVTVCAQKLDAPGTVDVERLVVRRTICQQGTCETEEHLSEDGASGGPGEILGIEVEPASSGSCVRVRSARVVDRSLAPVWTELGDPGCFEETLMLQGIARPAAAGATTPTFFFGTTRDGAAVRAADFEGVALLPESGQPAQSDASMLADASWPPAGGP